MVVAVLLCVLGVVAGASAGCVVNGDITCYTDVQSRILEPTNVKSAHTLFLSKCLCG